ncbi:protein FAM98A-like isoform X2 [Artemia franciscana]|uniref:protein FAM98A-like isoform X2 n=1 Tax=Artemia franciscana TaxID=6661 RepID=UPI0032DB7A24
MEQDIIDCFQDFKFQENFQSDDLEKILKCSLAGEQFTTVINWISLKLAKIGKTEEIVHPVASELEVDSFLIELSSLLRELRCPYSIIIEGSLKENLQKRDARLLLLFFLSSELQASAMILADAPVDKSMQIEIVESETAKNLRLALQGLGLSKPPTNISASQLFGKLESKLREVVSKAPPTIISQPLFTYGLTEKQWFLLQAIYEDMVKEYKMRRETLLKRVDVTIQSFTWSSRVKGKLDEIAKVYGQMRSEMHPEPGVRLAHILAARQDLAILEKTTSASVREKTKTDINRVIIGMVPDRGGRCTEQAPVPEMPSWQKRHAPPASQRGGYQGRGGRGGGGRGGRVQGGWTQNQEKVGGGWGGSQDQGYQSGGGYRNRY